MIRYQTQEVKTMPDCYQPGKERGLWYEIKCLELTINGKECAGEDASFERDLLQSFRAYAKRTGYKSKALDKDYHFNAAGLQDIVAANTTADGQISTLGIMKQRGRPRKTGEISRTTTWRREKQGELIPV